MELRDLELNLLVVFNQLLVDRRVEFAVALGRLVKADSPARRRCRRCSGGPK